MTERRARGTSPAGRGDRRTSRAARPRAADKTAAKRGRSREAAKSGHRSDSGAAHGDSDRAERTFLGLSTGKAIVLAIVVCGLALTLAVPMRTYFSQRTEAEQLARQRTELAAAVDKLRDRRAQQQDPAYIKSEARDRLRLVLPGETPYIVQVPGIEAPPAAPATGRPKAPDPWYTQLWHSIAQPPTSNTPQQGTEGPR
ncbi:septum formation initiator family protein [Nocardia panacis]|uniref:Septum formation initiator family protein n=1 Tax=Nocardia panacis TaxID=2340916 RepID=A0A3A4K5J0_9NOCA|nr:septum formation initiator family protein [Nocardia panacis]RJO75871.1 septum formation initiator family protein [Nocardia panacis]